MARTWILRISVLVTGAIIFFGAQYTWLGPLGMSVDLEPYAISLDSKLDAVRPWAPWWIMPSLTAVTGMLFWRWLAVRKDGVSIRGAVFAYWLTVPFLLWFAHLCMQVGAGLQYVPRAPLSKWLEVLPLMMLQGVGYVLINMMFHGVAMLLFGGVVATLTALAVRTALRLCPQPVPAVAARASGIPAARLAGATRPAAVAFGSRKP